MRTKVGVSQLVSYTLSLALSAAVVFQINPWLCVLLPTFLMALRSYWLGLMGLLGVTVYIVVSGVGGVEAFVAVMVLLLTLELASMVNRSSPLRHHVYVWSAVPSSFGLYILLRAMSGSVPHFRVTIVAVLLMMAMYLFVRDVLR